MGPELLLAAALSYPPCWQEGEPTTHPLFHQEYSKSHSPHLRIAFIRDHRHQRPVAEYVDALQGALDLAGVDVQVEVACESTWTHLPYGVVDAFYYVKGHYSQDIGKRNRADLVAVLSEGTLGYCGIATLGSKDRSFILTSATSCGVDTFVHEIGHNFGIHHAHQSGFEGRKGWCKFPADDARDCREGTVLSYSYGLGRSVRFADVDAGWGTEEHTAVEYLRESVPMQAQAWEIRTDFVGPDPEDRAGTVVCPAASHREMEWPNQPARQSPLAPTMKVRFRLPPSL